MRREKVDSSLAISVGYDALSSILEIEFKPTGAVWRYYNVPERIFLEMMSSSIGKYFNTNIKGQYPESQVV